jgi:hypothetical protein
VTSPNSTVSIDVPTSEGVTQNCAKLTWFVAACEPLPEAC